MYIVCVSESVETRAPVSWEHGKGASPCVGFLHVLGPRTQHVLDDAEQFGTKQFPDGFPRTWSFAAYRVIAGQRLPDDPLFQMVIFRAAHHVQFVDQHRRFAEVSGHVVDEGRLHLREVRVIDIVFDVVFEHDGTADGHERHEQHERSHFTCAQNRPFYNLLFPNVR